MFGARGHDELDTARLYCHGDTETLLGQLAVERFKIATKVWPTGPKAHGSEHLKKTFRESLEALKAKKVDIFYLHAPDYTTPFEETVQAVDELYREGLFDRYNAITRDVIRELFPCLKALNIAFYAYNPIAGGLLSGKYQFGSTNDGGRFDATTGFGKL
ncbi:Aflatoxin B1 aldehyde reductase member 2 [Modicella reniformis]|uniref:Aflatoxin B1 aldehyde reductase member 2 n=1 Tax=Modicella reniformis TaxID=1440133 RepID=A0A9P6IRF0_9FUNG|nr:Aflatoxin B1 aldehyde reductase member 2 [Modicella reniformis]